MLQIINYLPPHVVGIHAVNAVSEKAYKNALTPLLNNLLRQNKKINLILVLEANISNFTSGAWCGNINIGFRYFFKWNKVAIVTDRKGVLGYNDLFKYFVPGKFKTFRLEQLDIAVRWVSEK